VELYTLDSLLRRREVVDKFESLIWTERYSDLGDFELDIKSSLYARGLFLPGTQLATNNSYRVMTVESVEDTKDPDDKDILKVKGRSLEDVLDDRVARNAMTDTTTEPNWTLTGTPGDVARQMFDHVVRTYSLDAADALPFLQPGSIFTAGTLGEPATSIVWQQNPDSLLNAIKAVCQAYDLGFRLVRNFDLSQLYFDIYVGNDLTTRQTIKPSVVFAPAYDNIQNTSELTVTQGTKNVAYVYSPAGFKIVFGENVDPGVSGFDRRVLLVSASGIAAGDPDADALMQQAGMEALAAKRASQLFDGEINQYGQFQYGIDYNLGDIVETHNSDGVITYKRVTEHIYISDSNGDRSYPTLVADLFVGTNTWLDHNNDPTTWLDLDADLTAWADL